MSNVGGSAGEGGFDFQARLIAFLFVHILAGTVCPELGRELEDIPTAVSAETNGPGDDIQVELLQSVNLLEIQAKKGLRVDDRFSDTLDKIASGLVLDSSVNIILAVDPKTTKRIRENLAHDLKRLRQGRKDIPQDQELFNRVLNIFKKYAKNDEQAYELLKRLFTVTFDIETERSQEVRQALTLLQTHVLTEKEQAHAAWDILVYEGHQLIKERGRRVSIDLARLLQSRNIQLIRSLPPVLKENYLKWLMENTATFSIPGLTLGKPLPIELAWIDLKVLPKQSNQPPQSLDMQLATYHEREGLANRDDTYKALDVGKIEHRVVFIGSPGTGKSTLCRKIAHDLTILDEHVIWIRLSEVANYIDHGMTIDEALTTTATSSFSLSQQARAILFQHIDCLIADGLDECGSHVMQIADDLQQWASAHPDTRIVITTRPTGYDSRFFGDWEHHEILPLSKDQIEQYAYQLMAAFIDDHSILDQQFERFQTYLRQSRTVSLASRNPLLLGFLVQLSLADVRPPASRADLYEQIVDVWYAALLRDRKAKLTDLDPWPIQRSFDIVGWLFLHTINPGELSRKQSVLQVAKHLVPELDIKQPAAQILAEMCLQFWQERGVMELLQFMHESALTFVHPTLGEFAAARYLASLEKATIQMWVQKKYSDLGWREPLLLASGRGAVDSIVAVLLERDTANPPDTVALLLASAALAETRVYSHDLALTVIERLKTHLTSSATMAYEAARHAANFASQAPELFYPLLCPLLQHPQEWTRISAMYLLLVGDDTFVNLDILKQMLEVLSRKDEETQKVQKSLIQTKESITVQTEREEFVFANDDWIIENNVILLGAELLARRCPDAITKSLLQALYISSAISFEVSQKLANLLTDLGCQEFVRQNTPGPSESTILNWFRNTLLADLKMLETILSITNYPFTIPKRPRKLLFLTTLIYAINMPQSGITDWHVLRRLDDIQAIKAVVLGFIQAYSIPMKELALDTIWVLNEIQKAVRNNLWNMSLLHLLPHIPVRLSDPERARIDVPSEDLIRALKHPSGIIARGALYILCLSNQKAELRILLKDEGEKILQIIEKLPD
jgi:thymidylate kinase